MRDEEKQRIITLAIADVTDDEGQDLPTTTPRPQHPPQSQHPPLTQYPLQSQHPPLTQYPLQSQHPPLTQYPLQSRPPPHLRSPSQVRQASNSQSLPSLVKSIKPFYRFAFFGLLLTIYLRNQILSRPTSTALRPAAESVLVLQNFSVSADDFEKVTPSQHLSKDKCCRLPLPPRLSTKLLLPHPINASAHKAILDQTGWNTDEQLILLFEHQKLVSSCLRDVRDGMQWANQHLASMFSKGKFHKSSNLASMFSKGNFDQSSISKAINHFEARLNIALREIDELAALYSSMEECYKVFDTTSAGALLTDRMTPQQQFAIKWQPRSLELFNVNFREWYGVPWEQKVKRREDARLGLAVFDREFRRVQQIKSLFDALQNVTKECASEISEIDKPNVAENVWERIWSCYKTSDIGNLWTELLDFAKEDEDVLGLELTTEWCRS